jgi:shikimate kinase
MSKPILYFVTGISGSGKTTVARKLNQLGYTAFDSKINKDIFHFADADGNEAPDYRPDDSAWIGRYKWVLNKPMLEKLLTESTNEDFVFLCGRGNFKQHINLAAKSFLLKINKRTLLERLNDTNRDNLFAKDQATQQRLLADLDSVQKIWINAGAIVIDATQPIEKVVADILDVIPNDAL